MSPLNYYLDASKFILVLLPSVREPFLSFFFFLDKMKNWNGPHSVFQVHYTGVCAHTDDI